MVEDRLYFPFSDIVVVSGFQGGLRSRYDVMYRNRKEEFIQESS